MALWERRRNTTAWAHDNEVVTALSLKEQTRRAGVDEAAEQRDQSVCKGLAAGRDGGGGGKGNSDIDANHDEEDDNDIDGAGKAAERKREIRLLQDPCCTLRHRDRRLKGTTRRGGRGLKSAVTESPIIFRSLSFPPNQRIKASLQGPASVFSVSSSFIRWTPTSTTVHPALSRPWRKGSRLCWFLRPRRRIDSRGNGHSVICGEKSCQMTIVSSSRLRSNFLLLRGDTGPRHLPTFGYDELIDLTMIVKKRLLIRQRETNWFLRWMFYGIMV